MNNNYMSQLKELNDFEMKNFNGGGNYPELLGATIAAGILAGYFGLYGAAYAYYNYLKD